MNQQPKPEIGQSALIAQFIRFGLVGLSNTGIAYGIEMLCYYVLFAHTGFEGTVAWLSGLGFTSVTGEQVRISVTSLLAFIVSVSNSYFWNSRFVFKSGAMRTFCHHAKAYFKAMTSYAITGLLLAPVIKVYLSGLGIPYWIASLSSLIVTIPLNFWLNKCWAFQEKPSVEKTSSLKEP